MLYLNLSLFLWYLLIFSVHSYGGILPSKTLVCSEYLRGHSWWISLIGNYFTFYSCFFKVVPSSNQNAKVILCGLQVQTLMTSRVKKPSQSACSSIWPKSICRRCSLKARFFFWTWDQIMPSTRNYFWQ